MLFAFILMKTELRKSKPPPIFKLSADLERGSAGASAGDAREKGEGK